MEEEEEVIRFSSRASPGRTGGKTVPAKVQVPAGAAVAPGFVIHCKHLSNRQNFLRLYYDVLCNLLQEQQQQVRPHAGREVLTGAAAKDVRGVPRRGAVAVRVPAVPALFVPAAGRLPLRPAQQRHGACAV